MPCTSPPQFWPDRWRRSSCMTPGWRTRCAPRASGSSNRGGGKGLRARLRRGQELKGAHQGRVHVRRIVVTETLTHVEVRAHAVRGEEVEKGAGTVHARIPVDRKSTRLNSSHRTISYAVF